eukprot:768685_1
MSTPKRNWFLGPNKFSQTAKYEILLTDKKWHQVKITDKQQDNVCSTITLTTRDTKQSFNYRKPSDQPKVDYVGPCRLRRVNKRETVMYRAHATAQGTETYRHRRRDLQALTIDYKKEE